MNRTDLSDSKPSGDYVLNTVQNPALLEMAYRAIQNGVSTEAELADEAAIDPDTVENIATGLRIFDLVGKSDFEFDRKPLEFDHNNFGIAFRLHLLHSVAQKADPNDWGMQSALLLNLEYLLRNGRPRFSQIEESLIKDIDQWRQKIGYKPQSSQGRIKLNKPKFSFWTNQAEYLGLLHEHKGAYDRSIYVLRFDPDLIEASIEFAIDEVGRTRSIGFQSYLEWMEENCLLIPTTDENALPPSFSRTLYELVRDDRLHITKRGDLVEVELKGVPAHDRIAVNANELTIQS